LDGKYTLLFQKQYVIAAQKRNGYPKHKHPKVTNEEIWLKPVVRSRMNIKTMFWSKLEVLHATETKNVDMERCFFSIIFYTFLSRKVGYLWRNRTTDLTYNLEAKQMLLNTGGAPCDIVANLGTTA